MRKKEIGLVGQKVIQLNFLHSKDHISIMKIIRQFYPFNFVLLIAKGPVFTFLNHYINVWVIRFYQTTLFRIEWNSLVYGYFTFSNDTYFHTANLYAIFLILIEKSIPFNREYGDNILIFEV